MRNIFSWTGSTQSQGKALWDAIHWKSTKLYGLGEKTMILEERDVTKSIACREVCFFVCLFFEGFFGFFSLGGCSFSLAVSELL